MAPASVRIVAKPNISALVGRPAEKGYLGLPKRLILKQLPTRAHTWLLDLVVGFC